MDDKCFCHFGGFAVKDAAAREQINITNKKLDKIEGKIPDLENDIKTERERINNFTRLPEGSTAGDAELADIRVGYDGSQHQTAGEAVRKQISDVKDAAFMGLFAKTAGRNIADYLTVEGAIDGDTGADVETDAYKRTPYIPVGKGEFIDYASLQGLTKNAVIAIYDANKNLVSARKGNGVDVLVSGYREIKQDGYVRVSTRAYTMGSEIVNLRVTTPTPEKKQLNILVLGNSFSQDAFAYLPPVLNEILPDYDITYGVAYKGSTGLSDQVTMYNNGTLYTWFNYWAAGATEWERIANGTKGKNLSAIMSMKKWDIIYIQPNGSSSSDSVIDDNIIVPGRQLLRILQELNNSPFALLVGQWLAVSDTSFEALCNGMQSTKKLLGIYDYIPIGTAIQNARTNETFNALGAAGEMCYDNHMQSGIPALIATYTVALKILDIVGEAKRGIYGSTFVPTTENCISINAYYDTGMTGDKMPMTHGDSVGVVDENGAVIKQNIKAAQEIAVIAVNNPAMITNCENIIV